MGLFVAGKTTITYMTEHGEIPTMMATIGVDFEKLTINETSLMVWRIGGRSGYRSLLLQYYKRMAAFISVVDSNNHLLIDEAHEKLHQLVNDENFQEKSILIFANKQDLPNAMDCDQLRNKLNLQKLNKNIKWHLQPSSAIHNQGLQQGLEWLMNSILETFNDAIIMKNDFISTFNIDKLTSFETNLVY